MSGLRTFWAGIPSPSPLLTEQNKANLTACAEAIGPHDILIAATVIRHQATLVTRNVREFSRMSGLQWLNWHETA